MKVDRKRGFVGHFGETVKKVFSPISYEYVFPLYGTKIRNGRNEIIQLVGTSFYIKNNLFLTANHVIEECIKYSNQSIGFCNQLTSGCVELYNFKIEQQYVDLDIALISGQFDKSLSFPKAFKWSNGYLKLFQKVRSMGYPFGLNSANKFTQWRALEGSKVSDTFLNPSNEQINCYEVSFHSPRGLSGAPLFDEFYNIHGLMLTNSLSEMEVYHVRDVENNIDYRKTETIAFGLALHSKQIFKLKMNLLDGITFFDYFVNNKLLI